MNEVFDILVPWAVGCQDIVGFSDIFAGREVVPAARCALVCVSEGINMDRSLSMRALILTAFAITTTCGVASAADAETKPDLSAMVGQMFLVELDIDADRYLAAKGGDHRRAIADMVEMAETYKVGGFVAEGGNDALYLDPGFAAVGQTTGLDGLRVLIAVNEEGGAVQIPSQWWFDHRADWIGCTSLGPIPGYQVNNPPPRTTWTCQDHSWSADKEYLPFLRDAHLMGTKWTAEQTEAHARDIGKALALLNISMDVAPVLGVSDGTKKSSALGDRTFSDDPKKVARWAGAFSRGIRAGSDGRVVTVVKHFPGLGTVHSNTDDGSAKTAPLAELKKRDLIPYADDIGATYRAAAVMMSNAIVPGLTCPVDDKKCRTPATLSPDAYALLRGDYGWDGAITTDTLQTKAVLGTDGTMSEVVVTAIAAGADFVMFKPGGDDTTMSDYRTMLEDVRKAVLAWIADDQDTRTARIGQSIDRIKTLKASIASNDSGEQKP